MDLMFIHHISKNITTLMNIKGRTELHCWLISPQNISIDKVGEKFGQARLLLVVVQIYFKVNR